MSSNHFVIYILVFSVTLGVIYSTRIRMLRRRKGGHYRKRDSSGWSRWSRWDCPVTCGGGTAERVRHCIGRGCDGPRMEQKKCAEIPCPKGVPQFLIDMAEQQIVYNTRSYQLQKGEEITLNCQGQMENQIRYYYSNAKAVWHHNKEVYHPEKERIGVMDSMNLYIARVLPKDNGVWACEVELDANSPLYTAVYSITVENDAPDMEVAAGNSLSLPCNNVGLSSFFHSKLATQWYHNTSLYEEFLDAKPDDVKELTVKTSTSEDSGIWLCKVSERDEALRRSPKEWATNVIRVNVLASSGDGTINSRSVKIIIILAVVALVGIGVYYYCRVKKGSKKRDEKTKKLIDVEKGRVTTRAAGSGKNKDKPTRPRRKQTPPRNDREGATRAKQQSKKGTKIAVPERPRKPPRKKSPKERDERKETSKTTAKKKPTEGKTRRSEKR